MKLSENQYLEQKGSKIMNKSVCLKEVLEKAKDILIEEDDDKVLFIFINFEKGENGVTKYTYKRLKECVKSNLIDIYKIYNIKICGKAFVFWEIEDKVYNGTE